MVLPHLKLEPKFVCNCVIYIIDTQYLRPMHYIFYTEQFIKMNQLCYKLFHLKM